MTSLRRHIPLILGANIVYALCQWTVLIVLAKVGSTQLVGEFALGLAISTPLMMFSALQLRTLLVTDQENKYNFSDYLTVRLLAISVTLILLLVIVVSCQYNLRIIIVVMTVGLHKAVETLGDIFYGALQKKHHMEKVAFSLVCRSVLSLSCFIAIFIFSSSLVLAVLGMVAAIIIVMFFYDIPQVYRVINSSEHQEFEEVKTGKNNTFGCGLNTQSLVRLAASGVPLGMIVCLNSLNINIPRYFLEGYNGPAEMGIFAAICYFMRFSSYFETAVGQVALPRLAVFYAETRQSEFMGLLGKLLALSISFGAICFSVAWFFGSEILTLIYTSEYATHLLAFHLLILAAICGSVAGLLKVSVDATKTFAVQIPLFLVVATITFISSFYLIPQLGISGAAISLLLSKISLVIGYSFILYQILSKAKKHHPNEIKVISNC